MIVLLDIILPVFGIVLLGYGTTKFGFFGPNVIQGLTKFVFNLAVPVYACFSHPDVS